ncbi:hypothetical protein P7C70_g7853, partial [Phenoliferia sp. Uapishka_3]
MGDYNLLYYQFMFNLSPGTCTFRGRTMPHVLAGGGGNLNFPNDWCYSLEGFLDYLAAEVKPDIVFMNTGVWREIGEVGGAAVGQYVDRFKRFIWFTTTPYRNNPGLHKGNNWNEKVLSKIRGHRNVSIVDSEKIVEDFRKTFEDGELYWDEYHLERSEGLNHTQWIKFQKRAGNYALSGGKLYQQRGGMLREVVLDPKCQEKFLKGVHDETGHRGQEETSRRISDRVWWPGWSESVKNDVRTCEACRHRKPKQERERMNPTMSAGFFRKFNMDVAHIKEGKMLYLLTAREDLTGWVEGKALSKITSKAVSEFLSTTLIPRFRWFYQATLDGGAEFKGKMIDALKSFGIRRMVIAPYHPEANGMEERGHQPLVDCLVKICDSPKLWAKHLPMVHFADRISVRRTTGMTPFAMMYGTEAVLPIDHNEETWMISKWRDKQYSRSNLLKAHLAQLERKLDPLIESTEQLKDARLASVLYHNKVNAHQLQEALKPGALVLVHNAKLDNLKGAKFPARWTGPYRVVEKLRKGSYLLQ